MSFKRYEAVDWIQLIHDKQRPSAALLRTQY
jgi:hypothetical protein